LLFSAVISEHQQKNMVSQIMYSFYWATV